MIESQADSCHTTRQPLVRGGLDACLVHIYPSGADMGRRYPLKSEPVTIGRGVTCDIRIDNSSVSRKHAIIEPVIGGYTANDLQSTNGTYINDVPTSEPKILEDGDYLRVGNCIYRFLAGGNLEAEYHEEIYRLTIIDALTQLYNRRYMLDFLERELARAQRRKQSLAVLMVDIDHFKSINDKFGHLCGDNVLREMAGILKEGVRREDLIARYGGEEFCMVLVETDAAEATFAGERLRQRVQQHVFQFEGKRVPVTISVGVTVTDGEDNYDTTTLLKVADKMLYSAKFAGRNQVQTGRIEKV